MSSVTRSIKNSWTSKKKFNKIQKSKKDITLRLKFCKKLINLASTKSSHAVSVSHSKNETSKSKLLAY